jgi:anhydro-N-acetylmuramic acid kinase
MIYRVIGVMSGSSLDGLDIAFVQFEEAGGRWTWQIEAAECRPYPAEWRERLKGATEMSARDYMLLHSDYGHYIGRQVAAFMEENELSYRVSLIASHGHTTFHMPPRMTGQIGCGAAIAAETGLPVVTDLRALDVALGGQGAPIVPMGERLLFPEEQYLLNIGGIANLSVATPGGYVAFDTSPANRLLNGLVEPLGLEYDEDGRMAASGQIREDILSQLQSLAYHGQAYPKSLPNEFGTNVVMPILASVGLSREDALRTTVEYISSSVRQGIERVISTSGMSISPGAKMLITGGGALNAFLVSRIAAQLQPLGISALAADPVTAMYKEALIMGLLGVLRWREEATTLTSVTGASRDSVGGALWMGHS